MFLINKVKGSIVVCFLMIEWLKIKFPWFRFIEKLCCENSPRISTTTRFLYLKRSTLNRHLSVNKSIPRPTADNLNQFFTGIASIIIVARIEKDGGPRWCWQISRGSMAQAARKGSGPRFILHFFMCFIVARCPGRSVLKAVRRLKPEKPTKRLLTRRWRTIRISKGQLSLSYLTLPAKEIRLGPAIPAPCHFFLYLL